jgi:enoyl-[acyl-carrier protein] reductase I
MPDVQGLMAGKRGLVMGVANSRSIAWGIAKACASAGAKLAFTYQGEALKKRVEPLAAELSAEVVGHCDVTDAATIDAVFDKTGELLGGLDFLVHAIAFSDKDQLDGRYIETTADNFHKTMFISCYSLTAVAQRAEKLMTDGGSILTLTYYGAEKWMPHYNVMGVAKAALEASVRYLAADLGPKKIRVNAISAGPIKTLAASGIGDFRYIHSHQRGGRRLGALSPLRSRPRRDRRGPPCRRRLPHRRHEEPGSAGHLGGLSRKA